MSPNPLINSCDFRIKQRKKVKFVSKNRSRQHKYLLGKIGANLNQIAKRVNETRSIYQADMDAIKGEMEKIWKVQKAMLKKQPVMSQ